jgi:hypothetical protein
MASFLTWLAQQRDGILILLLMLMVLGFLVNWVLWMFGWGRFAGDARTDSKIRFVLTDFFVKIINDFRNLLALLIFFLFAVAIFAAIWPGIMKGDVGQIRDGLQAAAAALGGLIGSIIGYYFGESAASKGTPPPADKSPVADPSQQQPPTPETVEHPPIEKPAKPPEPVE